MPRGDRTGPWGEGPLTGGGFGYCSGYPDPGYVRGGPGRAAGRGPYPSGAGGWRHRYWFYATGLPGWARAGYGPGWVYPRPLGVPPAEPEMTREEEISYLKAESQGAKEALGRIESRLKELEEV